MPCKVMLADDDPAVGKVVAEWLKKAGYSVILSYSGNETLEKVPRCQPDILLMDVLLGDADGAKLCKLLRAARPTRHIPIILMSGNRVELEDMVSGLQSGADDYLLKPLQPRLLMAKIETVLRRMHTPKELGEVLKRYGLVLDVSKRTVRIRAKKVGLTRKEFDLLTALLRKSGKIVTPQFLLETVWGHELEDYNDFHTVQVHISRLKKKVGKPFAAHIRNVIGSGYQID